MIYRKAGLEDVIKLIDMRKKQLIDEGSSFNNDIDSELERFFTKGIEDGTFLCYLAIADDEVVSTCGVCFFQYPPTFSNVTGKVAYITNVYTKNEYRRQGIATHLLEIIIDEVKIRKCRMARLHASLQGKRLYEKMGFEDISGVMIKKI